MSHVWVRTIDGDLIRSTAIRQINVEGGLRIVLIDGHQFLLAETIDRQVAEKTAIGLATSLAEAEQHGLACILEVLHDQDNWTVETSLLLADSTATSAG